MQIRSTAADINSNGMEPAHVKKSLFGRDSGISHEFKNFVTDVEDLIKDTASLSGEDLTRAREKLSERIVAAKASFTDMGISISDQARKTATVTNHYVHEQPWNAVGLGAALGFLAGVLLGRRS